MRLSVSIRWYSLPIVSFSMFLFVYASMTTETGAIDQAVQGVGYPPIKTINKAQALLMARRAAILNAYGKILQCKSEINEHNYLLNLSKFIKGMKITQEELLADGGIRVTISTEQSAYVPVSGSNSNKKATRQPLQPQIFTPKQISREQWFKVISSMVIFETDNHAEKKAK